MLSSKSVHRGSNHSIGSNNETSIFFNLIINIRIMYDLERYLPLPINITSSYDSVFSLDIYIRKDSLNFNK